MKATYDVLRRSLGSRGGSATQKIHFTMTSQPRLAVGADWIVHQVLDRKPSRKCLKSGSWIGCGAPLKINYRFQEIFPPSISPFDRLGHPFPINWIRVRVWKLYPLVETSGLEGRDDKRGFLLIVFLVSALCIAIIHGSC